MVIATILENHMIRILCCSLLLLLPLPTLALLNVTLIQGLDGMAEYGEQFSAQMKTLTSAAESVTDKKYITVLAGDAASRDKVLAHFEQLGKTLKPADQLLVIMVGHGSYDGFEYKFNIPGPDLTDADLVTMLKTQKAKLQIIINTSSSSGALQALLKNDGRTVITATRNGEERLATRFGTYFSNALEDSAADTNKNNAISLQEAFAYAERMSKDYFEAQGQLATEHPVMSGDQAAQFVMARTVSGVTDTTDPELAQLLKQREQLDVSIEQLQLRKNELPADDYLNQLQQLMIDMSLVQDRIEQKGQPAGEK